MRSVINDTLSAIIDSLVEILSITFLLLVILGLLYAFCEGADYTVVSEKSKKCIKEMINFDLSLSPRYLWQAQGGVGEPGDCSGKLFAYCFRCGVKDKKGLAVKRLTSMDMCSGKGGWNFPKTTFEEAKELALICMRMNYKKSRCKGKSDNERCIDHIGILMEPVIYGVSRMAHANKKGFTSSVINAGSYWHNHLIECRDMLWDRGKEGAN